jgi:hypothetical protein
LKRNVLSVCPILPGLCVAVRAEHRR